MRYHMIIGEDYLCPKCGSVLRKDIDVGDGFLHDVCFGCGFKRKIAVSGLTKEPK